MIGDFETVVEIAEKLLPEFDRRGGARLADRRGSRARRGVAGKAWRDIAR